MRAFVIGAWWAVVVGLLVWFSLDAQQAWENHCHAIGGHVTKSETGKYDICRSSDGRETGG